MIQKVINSPQFGAMNNKTSVRRKRIKLWQLLLLAVLIWGGYVYWFVQRPILTQQGFAKAKLENQLLLAKASYASLSNQVKELHTSNYIAYIAEKKYNLVKPGEILFVIKSSQKK